MKSLVEELIEDKEFDKQIVKTFYSKSTLSPDIFHEIDGGYKMDEGVRDKLLNVANTFVDFIGVQFFIYDVVLTGSLANYNWSEYSDVDLHILIDLNEFGVGDSSSMSIIMKEFFDSKKNNWNSNHDIKIKGYDVELYVQDIGEKHLSSGVYSVLNDNWVIEPQKGKKGVDVRKILEKGEEYGQIIDDLLGKFENGSDITPEIEDVRRKLKNFRQSGLENGGEYSYENLTFKLLRRNGYIEKLLNLKKHLIDNKLSVRQ
jgi:hypothetical protein